MKKGFTLIELLIVIAIIAVLATVVILSLNPAELLRQARDSNRVSDISTLKTAISLYLTDVSAPSIGVPSTCYVSISSTVFWIPDTLGNWNATTTCAAWFATASTTATSSAPQSVTGNGWIPVNFNDTSAGSPIGVEPIDSVNIMGSGASQLLGALFYSYIPGTTTFKLGALMESQKYSSGGGGDVGSSDGGLNNFVYENGSNMNL